MNDYKNLCGVGDRCARWATMLVTLSLEGPALQHGAPQLAAIRAINIDWLMAYNVFNHNTLSRSFLMPASLLPSSLSFFQSGLPPVFANNIAGTMLTLRQVAGLTRDVSARLQTKA